MTTTDTLPAVEVPSTPIAPAPFGLLSIAPSATPLDPYWNAGVWWRAGGVPEVGATYGACTVDSEVPTLDTTIGCEISYGLAFTVYARSDLSIAGGTPESRFADARRVLLAGEQHAVEQVMWARFVAATPTATGTATSALGGLAVAEALMGGVYTGAPVHHMDRRAATLLSNELSVSGGKLSTILGSPVVAGGAYGLPADTADDASFTMFATGALSLYRSEVFDLGEAIDRDTNSVSAVVERTYVIGWDTALVEITVTPS